MGARSFTYDAAGNTTSDGLRVYAYNSFGRLSRVTIGTTTVDSTYNGQGLRVRKVATVNGVPTTTVFFHDDAGQLLGEYSGSGALIQETVWFAGMPVATIRPDGVYYVQADHLGTPRAVLRPADNALMWRWDSNPFGSTAAQEGTYGGGTFKYNLRFPGQYLDSETGLHYNVFRDFDPVIGRYVQSDPIGLQGGINTYAYVGGNSLNFSDPFGLYWFRQPWQEPGVVGRPGTAVEPGATVSTLIETGVPAGYTFGQMHDAFVDYATALGIPDILANVPSMPLVYVAAFFTEILRSLGIIKQPTPEPERSTPEPKPLTPEPAQCH